MKNHILIAMFSLLLSASVANAQVYLSSDLSIGSRGSDVTSLQSWLINNGFAIPSISSGSAAYGYFGAQTQRALAAYQASVGLPATGVLDQATRNRMSGINTAPSIVISNPAVPIVPINSYNPNYINQNYGVPVINGVDAPTVLSVGQVGTWTVRATDPYNGTLTYNVDWGDSLTNAYTGYATNSYLQQTGQSATFSHSYVNGGTYTVRFTVRNSYGQLAQTSVTVQVGGIYNGGNGGSGYPGNAGPLHVITPNGNEYLQKGTVYNITWTAPYYFRATTADIRLLRYNSCTGICPLIAYAPYQIASNININQNSFAWRVGDYNTNSQVPDGQYTVQICETGGYNCDSSDSPFAIYSSTYYPPAYPSYPTTYSPYQYQPTYPSNSVYQVPNCPAGYNCTPNTY